MTSSQNCSDTEKNFCVAFENNAYKNISIIFTTVSMPVCIVLFYGIIWFERFGSDNKRTLANKLFSMLCWSTICALLVCATDIVRYVVGPLPGYVCFIAVIARNAIRTQMVLFYDAILVTRYIFIFWIKNPGGVDDDFWCMFLSFIIISLSTIINFVIYTLPVKRPMFYFVCADTDPQLDLAKSIKPVAIEEILSVLLLIFIKLRISLHKMKTQPTEATNVFHKSYVLAMTEKQNIADFTSNFIGLASLAGFALLTLKVNSMTIIEINQFPHFLLLYLFQLIYPFMMSLIVLFMYYKRCEKMKETLQREFIDFFNSKFN
jgi:hypothetical protein